MLASSMCFSELMKWASYYSILLHIRCAFSHCKSSCAVPVTFSIFPTPSPMELTIQRQDRLWLRETLSDVHSCRCRKDRSETSNIQYLKAVSVCLEENTLRGDRQAAMFDCRVIQRVALVAIWRQAAVTAVEGREQVYMSSWLTVTCADECAAAYQPCSLMCTSTHDACLCVGVLMFAPDKGMWVCVVMWFMYVMCMHCTDSSAWE